MVNYTSSEVTKRRSRERRMEKDCIVLLLPGLSKVKSNLWPGFATYGLEKPVFDGICDVVNFYREYKRRNKQIS